MNWRTMAVAVVVAGAGMAPAVVAAQAPAKDIVVVAAEAGSAKPATALGPSLDVRVVDGKVKVDGATVVKADVLASNGVIHVIDTVVLPPVK